MSAKVSVIIPLYNAKNYIAKAINSVLNQTYHNIEIIVINDVSTDHPETILEKFKDRITLINLTENKGPANARNHGISKSTGDYISFLDSDDYYHPDKIQTELNYFEQYPKFNWIYSKVNLVDPNNSIMNTFPECALYADEDPPQGNIFHRLLNNNFLPVNAVLIKKEVFNGIMLDKELIGIEDWDLFIRIAEKNPIKFLNKTLSSILYRPDSLQRNIIRFQNNIIKLFEKTLRYSNELTELDKKIINKNIYTCNNGLGKEYFRQNLYSEASRHFILSLKKNFLQKRPYWFLLKIIYKRFSSWILQKIR